MYRSANERGTAGNRVYTSGLILHPIRSTYVMIFKVSYVFHNAMARLAPPGA